MKRKTSLMVLSKATPEGTIPRTTRQRKTPTSTSRTTVSRSQMMLRTWLTEKKSKLMTLTKLLVSRDYRAMPELD